MSFPKAKIKRFNEIPNCSPSPANYSIPSPSKSGGVIKTTAPRFQDQLSDNASVASHNSFRTPTPIHKKKCNPGHSTNLFKLSTAEELQAKIVECDNKNEYINDLINEIEDMKCTSHNLKMQIETLEKEKNAFQDKIKELNERHKAEIDNLFLQHFDERENLQKTIKFVSQDLKSCREHYLTMKRNNQVHLSDLLQSINALGESFNIVTSKIIDIEINERENMIKEKEVELEKLKDQYIDLEKTHFVEMEKLNKKHQENIQTVENEMLVIITDMERKLEEQKRTYDRRFKELQKQKDSELHEIEEKYKEHIESLIKIKEAELRQLEENYREIKYLAEIQMEEKCKDIEATWKLKLEEAEKRSDNTLKEYQKKCESEITQIEIEKSKMREEIVELTDEKNNFKLKEENLNEIEARYVQLQSDYDELTLKIHEISDKLKEEQTLREKQIAKIESERYAYEVTMNKNREALEVVKKRLLESDQDVERFKLELENDEKIKLAFEDKCNRYEKEIQVLTKKNQEIEEKLESAVTVYNEGIKTIEGDFLKKTEELQSTTRRTLEEYEKKLTEKDVKLIEANEQLDMEQKKNFDAFNLIKNSHKKIEDLEGNLDRLNKKIKLLEMEYELAKESLGRSEKQKEELEKRLADEEQLNNALNKKLSDAIDKNEQVDELMKRIASLNETSENYFKHCEYYKSLANEYEKEIDEMNKINKNYVDQSRKYAELHQKCEQLEEKNKKLEMELADIHGHQNHMQKIKHMIDLKERNLELFKENQELEKLTKKQAKTIEKLMRELALYGSTPKKINNHVDKENLLSGTVLSPSPLKRKN